MTFGHEVENATVCEILSGDDVAVQEDHGGTFTLLEVMEPHTVHIDEPAPGRVSPLHPASLIDVENGCRSQCRGSDAEDYA
jgi:hypothetical protein